MFTLAVTIVNLPLGFIEHSLTPIWVAICADFCFITFFVRALAAGHSCQLLTIFNPQTLYLWGYAASSGRN